MAQRRPFRAPRRVASRLACSVTLVSLGEKAISGIAAVVYVNNAVSIHLNIC